MDTQSLQDDEIVSVVFYTIIAFLLLVTVLILFFYFSRKKIIKQEKERRNLEVNHQKMLLRSVIITQEDERKRIAQDLHDDISSKLNIVSLNSHLLKTPNLSDIEFNEITANIIDLTKKALENSRRIAHDLLPPVLEKFGLHAGIEELIVEVSSNKIVKVNYKNQLDFNTDEAEANLHVFRILQELINNSIRHGKATEIMILFCRINQKDTCVYKDNGGGFEMTDYKNSKGLGMRNIESRVNFLNGSLKVNSEVNKGIEVIFNF